MTEAEQVSLYTSSQTDDLNPQYFQYYLDWPGSAAAQAAATYLQLNFDPSYGILLISPAGSRWLDLDQTLRAQGITNGNQIVYTPLNQATQAMPNNNNTQEAPTEIVQEIQAIAVDDDIDIPTAFATSTFDAFQTNRMMESDADVDDIFVDTNISDFATNNFGGLRRTNLSLLTGENDGESAASSKSVKISTCFEFEDKKPVNVNYKLSSRFDDMLGSALNGLMMNRDGRYSILLKFSDYDYKWFKDDDYLENLNPIDDMTCYVFKRDRQIKVMFENQATPYRVLKLDIQKDVKDLVEEIAGKQGFESFLGFTLWAQDKKEKFVPLSPNMSIPQQTSSFKTILYKRRYFIFSREDLVSFDTSFSAYQDAVHELSNSQYAVISEDTALNYLSLCVYAESEKPDLSHPSEKLLEYLPPTFKGGKDTLSKLKSYLQKFEKTDRFNACRRVLRFLRRLPGFATSVFDDVRIEIKNNKKKNSELMNIQISPLTIKILNPKSGTLEERISLSKIISMNLYNNNLEIQFTIASSGGKTGKYNFIHTRVEEIQALIETYSGISKMIMVNRARIKGSIAGVDLSVIDEKNRIMLFTTTDLQDEKPKKFAYDSKFTGSTLIKCAEQNLELPHDDNHVVLVKMMKNSYRWIPHDTILSFANVQEGMTVYLLTNNRPVRVHHTDGHTKTMLIDITKTIEELTPIVFQKETLPNIVGYTFYTLEDPNNPRPLDTRYSIPEQTWKYNELLFKRRFYVLSGEVLQTPQAANATVADCNTLLLDSSSNLKVTEDEIIELGILYLYSNATNPTDVKTTKKFNYETMIPSYIKTDKKFDAKFTKAVAAHSQQERFNAAKAYLGIIRQLPGFGEEKFTVTYADASFGSKGKVNPNTTLSIGPMKIIVQLANAKTPVFAIPYRFIVSFQSMNHKLSMKFVENGKILIADFKIREIDTVLMLINYNIKIIRDLLLAKQRKKQKDDEDTIRRLNGGFIDEDGVLRTKMIDFLISAKLDKREGLPKMWLELKNTGKETTDLVVPVLRLNGSIEYAILLWMLKKYYKWVGKEDTLASRSPYRRTIMFVLVAYPMVKVIFSMGVTKTIIIPIMKTIEEIIPMIATKLGLKHSIGFTLYLPIEGQEPKPLDLTISLPEQTNFYDILEFKRRFFVITKYDMDDQNSLYITYCDVRALILSGKVEMPYEKAIELLYYSLYAETTSKVTKETLPNEKEMPAVIPAGTKLNFSKAKKILLDMLARIYVESRDQAMIKYIQIARAIPTFGTEQFLVVLVEERKGHLVRQNVYLYVAPYRVFIKDESKKRELVEVPYKRFIRLEAVEDELSMKYCGDDFKPRYVDIESEKAEEIASLILSHLNIHKQILMRRINDSDNDGLDRIELLTIFCSEVEKGQRYLYDMRDKGSVIIEKAIKYLNLNPKGQYSCLLRRCEDEFSWVGPDTVLGTLNPFDGLTIHIYLTYMPVEISTDSSDPTKSRKMLLNIERPIYKLIDEIAFKMYVDHSLGYTLYRHEGENMIPLDLYETIPEQTINFSKLFFKREFLMMTHEDVVSLIVSRSLYKDVVDNIISGVPIVADKEFNIPKELVVAQAIANFPSKAEAVGEISGLKNFNGYLPKDMKLPKNFKESVAKAINAAKADSNLAIIKLIMTARGLNHFGCQLFSAQIDDKAKQTEKKDQKKNKCTISIGPCGVHLFSQNANGTISDLAKIDYANVVNFAMIKDRIILRVSEDGGIPHVITIITKSSVQVHKLLRQYKNVLVPILEERKEIQSQEKQNMDVRRFIEKSKLSGLIMFPERQLDHPNPNAFKFDKDLLADELILIGMTYLVQPNKVHHTILLTKRRRPDEKDVEYEWLEDKEPLSSKSPVDNSFLFIVQTNPLAQVITSDNFVYEMRYPITETIFNICKDFTIELKLGTHLGYTLYEKKGEKSRPLDFLFRVPEVSPNYVELFLKRRFYLFSLEILQERQSLISGYEDVRGMVLSGNMSISGDAALELAIYSLYAQTTAQMDVVRKVAEINESELRSLIPPNVPINANILRKFKAVVNSLVPLDQDTAMKRYIIMANSLNGYGSESYKCKFTDCNNVMKKGQRESTVILSPYKIIVEDEKTRKTFSIIDWHLISNYERKGNGVEIIYNNEEGFNCHILLESDDSVREIYSFINDLLALLRRPEFAHFPDFNGNANGNQAEGGDFGIYGGNFDYDSLYDDVESIDARGLDIDFDNFDNNLDNNLGDDGFGNNGFNDDDGNDFTWRASDEGLIYDRAGNLLDDIYGDLGNLRNHLGDMDPNELARQLNFINDEMRRFANDLDDDGRDRMLGLASGLDSLRETAQHIATADMEITSFVPQLQSMIDKFMCSVVPTKEFFLQRLKALKLKSIDDIELGAPRTMNIPKDDALLAMDLLRVSDVLEKIASVVHANYSAIRPVLDPTALIHPLQAASTTITNFASNLVNQNGDLEMIRRHLVPQLNDISKINDVIGTMNSKLKAMNVEIPSLCDLSNKLGEGIANLLASPHLTRVNPGQQKLFSLYPGQTKTIDSIIKDIEAMLRAADQIINNPSIASNKTLQTSIFAKLKNLSDNAGQLYAAINMLKTNPNNDLARSEALAALFDAKGALEFIGGLIQPLANVPVISEFYQNLSSGHVKIVDALNRISPINITPSNVQHVLDDVNMFRNRYAALSADVIARFTDKERDDNVKTLTFLQDFVQQMDKILPLLEKCPTSGEVVFFAQQVMLKLYDMLPNVQTFANSLHRITIDKIYPVLYERLFTNVKSAISETVSTEDISKLPHLINFQKLQVDTGAILNLIKQLSAHPRIVADSDLFERVNTMFNKMKDNYLKQVVVRGQLRERPFADDTVLLAHDITSKLLALIEKIQPTAHKVSDTTSNLYLEQQLNSLLTQTEKTLELIKKAKMEPFRMAPKVSDITALSTALGKMNNVVSSLSQLSTVKNDVILCDIFKQTLESFNTALENLKVLEKNPTKDFYKVAEKLQKRLMMFTPTVSQLPEFNKNQQYRDILNQLLDQLSRSLESTPPTLDIVKSTIKDFQPTLIDFSNCLADFLRTQNVAESAIASNLFNGWLIDLSDTNTIVQSCLDSKEFDVIMANSLKVALLNLMNKLSSMPMSARDVLTKEQKIEFSQKLGNLARQSILTVNCIRQLPGNKRIFSNPNLFKKIENDEELSESIQAIGCQCGSLQGFFTDLIEAKMLVDRPYALDLIKELKNQIGWVKISDFKPDVPESTQLTVMQQLKERMPYIITSTELIAPIIGDPNIVKNIRQFGDNLTIMSRLLSAPHLTLETSDKFKKIVTPLINNLLKELDPFLKKDNVKNVKLLFDSATAFNNVLALSGKEIGTAKPRRTQLICDNIYQTSALLLPYIQENPDHEKVLKLVNELFDICTPYTSLPQMRVRFTDCLLVKKPIFTDESIQQLSKQTSEVLRSNAEIKDEFFDNVADNLGMVIDHHNNVPAFVGNAALIYLPAIKAHSIPDICGSVRTIASSTPSFKLLEELLARLIVDSSVRAAMQINSLSKSLPFLQQQIEQNPSMFDDEARFNFVKLENAIKHSDTALLLQCQSLPTTVFNFKAMRNVDDSIQLLLKSVSGIEKIRPIVQPLITCGKEYSDWIYQSDMAMIAYFQANMDAIATSLENISISDKTNILPQSARDFVRQTVTILRDVNRGTCYDMSTISALSQLLMSFQSTILPQISAKLPESDDKKNVIYHVSALDKIKPILKLWANPVEELSKESIRLSVSASLFNTQLTAGQIKAIIETNPESISYLLQPMSSRLSSIISKLTKGVELKMPFGKSLEMASSAHSCTKSLTSSMNLGQLSIDLDRIINFLNGCSDEIIKSVPIEFADFDEIQNFTLGSYQALFSMIDDKDCLKFAQLIAAYLDKLLTSMKTMSNSTESILTGPQKYFSPIQIKTISGKILAIPRIPTKVNSFTDSMAIRCIDNDTIQLTIQALENALNNATKPSNEFRSAALKEIERLMLAQRLSMLLQQQVAEFPDVIKTINLKSQSQSLSLSPDQIDSALRALQQQFDSLESSNDLHKVQTCFSPEQIYVQQVVLTHALSLVSNNRCPLPTSLQATESQRKQLFEKILLEIETNGSPTQTATFLEIRSGVIRGLSQVSLINQLIAVMQQLNVNIPDIFKFIQTPEGIQLLKVPITAHQLLSQQQAILKQVQLTNSPEMLNVLQKNLLPDDVILQQRIIQHMLTLLTSDFGKALPMQKGIETSTVALFSAVNLQQQELIKADPDVLKLTNYITPSDILIWQQEAFNLLNRLSCAQTLVDISLKQLNLNPNATSLPKDVKSVACTREAAKTQHASLIKEYDLSIDIDTLIKGLTKKQLEDEQNVLAVATFLALSPSTISLARGVDLIATNLNGILTTLFSSVQAQQTEQLKSSGEPLDGINPLKDSSILMEHDISEFNLLNLRRAQQIKSLITHLEMQYPELRKVNASAMSSISGEMLESSKAIIAKLVDLLSSNPVATIQFIEQIPKDALATVHSMLLVSTNHPNVQRINLPVLFNLQGESQVFDLASLIQAQPSFGLSSATSEQKALIPLDNINGALKTVNAEYSCEAAKLLLNNLMLLRSAQYPDIASVQARSANMNDLYANNSLQIGSDFQSIAKQLHAVNEGEKLDPILSRISPTSLLSQQILIQCILNALDDPVIRKGIGALSPADLANPMNIISSLIDALTKQLSSDKTPYVTTVPLLHSEIAKRYKLCDECKNRFSLAEKLLKIQLGIRNSLKGIAAFVSSAKDFEASTNLPFTVDEITDIQGAIRSVLASNISNEEIVNAFQNQKPQVTSRILSLLSNLTLIIAPPSLHLTTVKTNADSQDDDIFNLPSLYESVLNIGEIGDVRFANSSMEIRIPSEKQRASRVASSLNNILTIIPTMIHIPVQECIAILTAENQAALSIIKDLYASKSSTYSMKISDLIEIVPQLMSSYARVVTTIPENVRAMIIKDPLDIVRSVENLQKSACDEECTTSFKQELTNLLSAFSNIEAVTVKSQEELVTRSVECFAKMATSIQRNDIDQLNYQICVFKALQVHSAAFKLNDSYLKSIAPDIQKIEPIVSEAFTKHSKLDSTKLKALSDFRLQLVQIINKETKNPFTLISSLSKPDMILPIVNDSKLNLERSTNNLVAAVHARNKEGTISFIGDIIKTITLSQSAMARGFSLVKPNMSSYQDYLAMINSSLNALRSTMDIANTTAISSTAIKRSTRSFTRMLNSMIDMAEDQIGFADGKEPASKLDKSRLTFLQTVCNSVQLLTTTVCAKTTCFIPETFSLFMKEQIPKLDKLIVDLKTTGLSYSTANTDKSASEDFTLELNALEAAFNAFRSSSSSINIDTQSQQKQLQQVTYTNITNEFIEITENFQKMISITTRFTDAIQLKPDLESAEKIQKSYNVPSVPSDIDKLNVNDANTQLKTLISKYNAASKSFFDISGKKESKNLDIANSMNSLYSAVDEVVKQILRVSTTTMNLEIQSSLATSCSNVAKSFDSLLKELRARFVLSGDWENQSKEFQKQLESGIKEAEVISANAVKIAKEESLQKSAILSKFDEYLRPLIQASSALEKSKDTTVASTNSAGKEYSLRMLEIGIALSSAVNRVMLHSRGKASALTGLHEAMFGFTQNVSKELGLINKAVSEIQSGAKMEEIETKVVERMKILYELGNNYTKSTKPSTPEETALCDAISMICKGANTLAQSAESALNTRKENMAKRGKESSISVGPSKDTLLKRLDLESKVIRARIILEHQEKILLSLQ